VSCCPGIYGLTTTTTNDSPPDLPLASIRPRPDAYRTPNALIDTVEEYPELLGYFVALAASELDEAQTQLEREHLSAVDRAAAERVVALIEDPDSDWSEWVRAGGLAALPNFLHRLDDWLADPVQWQAMEWWPKGWSGQGRAMSFFRATDSDTLDALGVVIVEGEHAGTSDRHCQHTLPDSAPQRRELPS